MSDHEDTVNGALYERLTSKDESRNAHAVGAFREYERNARELPVEPRPITTIDGVPLFLEDFDAGAVDVREVFLARRRAMGAGDSFLQFGDFTLNSGAKSKYKFECDNFTDEEIKGFAYLISCMVHPFSSVSGVPRGGLRLAKALEEYVSTRKAAADNHLLVDDVLTTGGSLEREYMRLGRDLHKFVQGAVIIARGKCPGWVTAVLQMPECFWVKPPE